MHSQHHFGQSVAPNVVQRLSRVCFANTFDVTAGRTRDNNVTKQRENLQVYQVQSEQRSVNLVLQLSWWRSTFFSFGVVFSQFLPSNAPITPYNIRYWWFFLSQGNRWIKYRAHPKIRRPKPYQLIFVCLVALNSFHPVLSTQIIADLFLECSDGSMFYPCHIPYKKFLFIALKNSYLNHRCVVFINQEIVDFTYGQVNMFAWINSNFFYVLLLRLWTKHSVLKLLRISILRYLLIEIEKVK